MSSPWTVFLPQNVSKHPAQFVGPNVAGAIVQSIETGILINQSVRFWSRSSGEPGIIKLLAAFVSIVALFQTCIAIYNTWRVVVLGFGNWEGVVFLEWPDRIQPALNCAMAAPFQAFLIYRCWNVMQRRWIILVPLASLLLASVGINVYITADIFYAFKLPLTTLISTDVESPRGYMSAFIITATLDILITVLMLWFLIRAKSQVVSRRLDKILARLSRMMWEAAVPPCACAIAACIVYISMSMENLWDVFCQSILGKLYVISLFVILNGSADLRRAAPITPSAGMTKYWITDVRAEFRVHLTSEIDLQDDTDAATELTPTTDSTLPEHSGVRVYAHKSGSDGHALAQTVTTRSSILNRPPAVLHRTIRMGDRRLSY
ncbi:hypothetical protein M0805_006466 [Coniferiporia weirii]|nr:hypothetical protein M0805_006466 [Coniferiporia weirii]